MNAFKTIIRFALIVIFSFSVLSCRNSNDAPEDIHEHEEANKITLTLSEKGTANKQTVTYQTGSGADKALMLESGKTYTAEVKFYHAHGTSAEDLTPEIITEKDEHFMEYAFAGVAVEVLRAADDVTRTDGKKLGLKTQWKVTSAPANAKANLKLIHGAATVDDTASNGGGKHTGGETDIDVSFDVK